jgi:O-antigen biosynthesis protein
MKFTGERIIPNENFCGSNTNAYLEHTARYNFATKFVAGKKILDLACGVGYGSKILSDSNASEIFACDISSESIDYAQKNYGGDNIKFQLMDGSDLQFPDAYFDCIVSFETIEHVPEFKKVLNEFHRVLKNDGLLIISTPNKDVTSKGRDKPINPFHFKEFTVNEFSDLLNNLFDNVTLFSQLLIIPINFKKKFSRLIFHTLAKLDFLKLYTKILSATTFEKLEDIVNNTNGIFEPIKYKINDVPVIIIAVCKNKN